MPDLAAAERILRTTFGFEAFRPGQDEIVASILDGRDVLAVMPTGSGKSLCYQLPALLRDGLTVVVSPLIALMRNQVAQLRGYGIAAAALNSANDAADNWSTRDQIARGELRLLYIAPERLVKAETLDLLKRAKVGAARGRRGALHLAMGPRLSPGIRDARRGAGGARRCADGRVHGHCRCRHAHRYCRQAFQPSAGGVRPWLRSAEFAAGDAGQSRRAQADRRLRRRSSRAKAASSIAPRGARPRSLPKRCAAAASQRSPITQAWTPWSARAIRTGSCRTTASSWSRPWRSAWASTSRISASCSTPTCRPTSRAITRRSAAPAATGSLPTR